MAPADPVATGTVQKDGQEFRTVKEGKATILVPQGAKIGADKSEVQQVFYNPIQQFNRDLSVLAIKAYGEEALERKRAQYGLRKSKKSKKRKRAQEDEAGNNGDGSSAAAPQQEEPVAATTEQAPGQQQQQQQQEEEEEPCAPTFKILDALSASGLRALRYAHELPFVTQVTANDLSPSAANLIKTNVEHNGLAGKIQVNNDDALALMYRAIAEDLTNKDTRTGQPGKTNKFDVVDLDPYGTGAPFFDAAVQAVRDDGGLLCITCTDSAVWAGHSYCEKSFSLYGGTPVKGMHSHEVGLRLVLNSIASSAARYGLDIEPQLCMSIDFYTKFFVRVTRSPQNVKFLGAKTMVLYSCDHGCGAWQTQYLMKSKVAPNKKGSGNYYKHVMALGPTADQFCPHCGTKTHLNGPMYGGRIHSPDFVRRLLTMLPDADPAVYGTKQRLEGMLQTVLEENITTDDSLAPAEKVNPKEDAAAAIDPCPFYFVPSRLAGVISCASPPDGMVRGALAHLGYQVSRSHCRAGSIKTDAPWSTVWWIMTEWARQKAPVKVSKFKPAMPAWKILKDAGLLGGDEDTSAKAADDAKTEDATTEDVKAEDVKDGEDTKMAEDLEPQQKQEDATTHGKSLEVQADVPEQERELRKSLVFDDDLARRGQQTEGRRLVRYQANPEKNWGPMNRAKAH
ncbi:tRNA (guanine26-N2/guanine27-N2)-dimethyltransferase [Geosmithia morbida]|uniref:tRNA (guanine(26)-N(2))-dimethyltransferase n=1 Tax=Geosmithia morbida TaxID=1094350 RepID=A0A9P4Z2T4_9HYPO|nr:tRNA (guanine26-N2/guanine27-N2)-dimethyltransferase [Geosmithia morbida]KAF4126670.1 tRNA (guanine26-N2/guanine27-N2)-dimethyltransferase [Geosmithia morbida]